MLRVTRLAKAGKFFLLASSFVLVVGGSSAAFGAENDNPEYQAWAKCKVGTAVKVKTMNQSGPQKTEVNTTSTLVDLKPDKAVVETTGSAIVDGKATEVETEKRVIPAKLTKASAPAEPGEKPEPKGPEAKPEKDAGDDSVKVVGKDLKCKWNQSTVKQEGRTHVTKVWQSDDVPGGVAKVESSTTGGDTPTTISVTVTEVAGK